MSVCIDLIDRLSVYDEKHKWFGGGGGMLFMYKLKSVWLKTVPCRTCRFGVYKLICMLCYWRASIWWYCVVWCCKFFHKEQSGDGINSFMYVYCD